MTDQEIHSLIACPKRIVARYPSSGYRIENHSRRCDLDLETAIAPVSAGYWGGSFKIFIRQSVEFVEGFSIGLRYQTSIYPVEFITLVRYNGPHGETGRDADGHYALPHIHRITAAELSQDNLQPQEKDRQITNRYSTFEQALTIFFNDIDVTNYIVHFPDLG